MTRQLYAFRFIFHLLYFRVEPNKTVIPNPSQQAETMRAYYQLHAKIYDLTRWSFLFGRKKLIQQLAKLNPSSKRIVEIGCGTGYNLCYLASNFPQANIMGLDVSKDMLNQARKQTFKYKDRIQLVEKAYQLGDSEFSRQVDILLFSYSLTMINPQWKELLTQAASDLSPEGLIGVVDFYNSPYRWFKEHMGNNHVRMDGHLSPVLKHFFYEEHETLKKGYGGLWNISPL